MAPSNATWQYQDRPATALNEVGVLDEMGRDGWELIGFGMLVLNFRRSEDDAQRAPWVYERLTGSLPARTRDRLEGDGWIYCGSWMNTYHYFKRAARIEHIAA